LCEPEEAELRERLANAERLVRVDTALARRLSEIDRGEQPPSRAHR
jgi:hypothetical protein